jgi:hypothetical protein
MKDPIQFTDRERFLISYYRAPSVSSWSRTLAYDASYAVVSVLFIALYLTREDAAWGFVGYVILLYRVGLVAWQSSHWLPEVRGIIDKYEARIAELEKKETQT